MSLAEDTQVYGRKPAVLNYIREHAPKIPIEPFVLVADGEDWQKRRAEIDALGRCLVRSASPVEGGRYGFSGLMRSECFQNEMSVQWVVESFTSDFATRYAEIHGVATPIPVRYFFHKASSSQSQWTMLRHPHIDDAIFISGGRGPGSGNLALDFVFNQKTGKMYWVKDFGKNRPATEEDQLTDAFRNAVGAYEEIESLPEFRNGFTYAMEFGMFPFF